MYFYSGKVVVFGQKMLYSSKSGCIQLKWLYSGREVLFGQNGCVRATRLYSGKVVVFARKLMYSGKSGFNRSRLLYLGKSGCIRIKVVVFG